MVGGAADFQGTAATVTSAAASTAAAAVSPFVHGVM